MRCSGPLPHGSGAQGLLTKNTNNCCLTTTEKLSWVLPWPSTTVTSLQAQSQKAHFWAWLRKKNSLNTKLQTCYRKFSENALILRASWQILLSKFMSGWSWRGQRKYKGGDWQIHSDYGLCLIALISSRAISFSIHLPMAGAPQNCWKTTSAGTFLQDPPHIYTVVPKSM